MKNESLEPGPGLSTSEAAFSQLTKEIADQNDEAQAAAQVRRGIRDDAARVKRQEWDR